MFDLPRGHFLFAIYLKRSIGAKAVESKEFGPLIPEMPGEVKRYIKGKGLILSIVAISKTASRYSTCVIIESIGL